MSVKEIETAITRLTPEELAELRNWFYEFDWQRWDEQIERDAKAGKLDSPARKALEDHAAGRTKPL
jgi:hypothetical protein